MIDSKVYVVSLVLAVFLSVAFVLWLQSRWQTAVLKRRFRRAVDAEAKAPRLLERLGYEVLGAQIEGGYELLVDGQPVHVPLRADYLVQRTGLTFVAEVKSGNLAPKLTTASTRRQLLEYLIAFRVDGVLLVDSEAKRVQSVVYPIGTSRDVKRSIFAPLALLLFAITIIVCIAWIR